ncbi:hypothetical protein AVEN_253519-1 [Araneus ventricosus]|uniref:Uncharacterized protein n=1 Tax=Araneus ventricosus TaxID=182803 RepID=A0A4Y2BSZ4_ARAVE|nr:hypothetical protein AVEN_253519-1 [Araneus ventricosus]
MQQITARNAEFRSHQATVLHNALLHQFYLVVINKRRLLTTLLTMDILATLTASTACLRHLVRIHKLYDRPIIAVGGKNNKRMHFQPLQFQ